MGHIARLLEEAGIPTVIIGIDAFRQVLEAMSLPRLVVTQSILGRPVGIPGDKEGQRAVLQVALDLLEMAEQGGAITAVESD